MKASLPAERELIAGADTDHVKVVNSQGQIVYLHKKSRNMVRKSGKLSIKSELSHSQN